MRRSPPNRMMDHFVVEGTQQLSGDVTAHAELAHDLGYQSVRQMMEQTELVPLQCGAYVHLTTDSDGYWVAWSEKPTFDIQRFESRQSALIELREREQSIFSQS